MKLLVLTFLALLLVLPALAQAPSRSGNSDLPKKDECSIAGMVVKLAGSESLSGELDRRTGKVPHAKINLYDLRVNQDLAL